MEIKFQHSPLWQKIYNSKKRILLLRGGSGSSKTYSMCQIMVDWLLTGNFLGKIEPKGVWSVVRKHSTTLDKSVMRDAQNVLSSLNFYPKFNKSTKTYEHNGRILEFFGADDEQKLRGGRRDFLYCNEANELNFLKEFHQLNLRTRKRIFLDFNPDDEDVWLNTEIEMKRAATKGDVDIIKSTYKDNPFLSPVEVNEIEHLQKIDPMLWQIYGLGEYGKMQGLVFDDVNIVTEIPENAKFIARGLDFGYSNDPSGLYDLFMMDNELYFNELIYERGLTNDDISKKMTQLNLNKSSEIFADQSEPKSIEELSRLGWNIFPVKKGADQINFGIDIMKRFKINVTERSINLRKEFKKYKWAEDKNGKATNKPIDAYNHGIDACRYVCMMKLASGLNVQTFKQYKSKTTFGNIYEEVF